MWMSAMISEIPTHPRLVVKATADRRPQARAPFSEQQYSRLSRDAAVSEITACNPRTGHVSLISQQFAQLHQQRQQQQQQQQHPQPSSSPAIAPKPRQWGQLINQGQQNFDQNPNHQIANQLDHSYNPSANYSHHLQQQSNNQLHQFQEQVNCHSPPLPPPPPPPPGVNKIGLNSNNHINSQLGHSSLATPSTPSGPNVSSLARSPNSSDHLPPAFLSSSINQQHQQQPMNKNQPRHLFGQLDSLPSPQIRQSITNKRQGGDLHNNDHFGGHNNQTDQSSSDQSFGFQNVAMAREGDEQTVQYIDSSSHGYRPNGARGSFTSSHLASARVDSVIAARKSLLVKRPSNRFLSQLYFLFHVALSICLIQASDATWQENSNRSGYFHQIVVFYLSYLLSTSIVFIFLIRFCKNEYIFSKNFKPGRQSVVFYGCVVLGIIQLASISFDLAACSHRADLVLMVLHFFFVFFLLHFIFTQASYGTCGYPPVLTVSFASNTSDNNSIIESLVQHLEPVNSLIEPITHHYQLLSILVISSLWFLNNNLDAITALTSGIGLISDAEQFSYSDFFQKHTSIKGFFLGFVGLAGSIVVLTLKDHELSLMVHTILQGTSAMASIIGLFLRKEKLMMKSFYQPFFASNSLTSAPDHHLIISVTVLTTYYCSICMIVGNLVTSSASINIIAISDGICMLCHITLQTFLIRSGERRKTGLQRQFFAFLILSNLSIWIIEIVQVSVKLSQVSALDSPIIMPLLMSFNRLYSVLLFIHFWKSK